MDYVFNGLATTSPDPGGPVPRGGFARSDRDKRLARVMAAGRGRPRTLPPDLLIVFAICRLAEEEEECRAKREQRQLETQAQLMELENRMADSGDQGEDGGEDGEGQRKGLGTRTPKDAAPGPADRVCHLPPGGGGGGVQGREGTEATGDAGAAHGAGE